MSEVKCIEMTVSEFRRYASNLRAAARDIEIAGAFVGGIDAMTGREGGWPVEVVNRLRGAYNEVAGTANSLDSLTEEI